MYKCINLWRIHCWLKLFLLTETTVNTRNFAPEWASGKPMGKKLNFGISKSAIFCISGHKKSCHQYIRAKSPWYPPRYRAKEPATALLPGATHWQLRAVATRTYCPPRPIVLATLLQAAPQLPPAAAHGTLCKTSQKPASQIFWGSIKAEISCWSLPQSPHVHNTTSPWIFA